MCKDISDVDSLINGEPPYWLGERGNIDWGKKSGDWGGPIEDVEEMISYPKKQDDK